MAANDNPGAGRTWIRLTEKARRELMIADPPQVLRELAAQVEAHVPLAWERGMVWGTAKEERSCRA